MSTLQFRNTFLLVIYIAFCTKYYSKQGIDAWRSLHQYALSQIYRLFLIVVETWRWSLQAEICSFIIRL